jgi:simple sugar transport system permease protein
VNRWFRAIATIGGLRLERRTTPGGTIRYRAGSALVGIVVSFALALAFSDVSVSEFVSDLWDGTFGTPEGIEDVTTLATPLVFLGLAASIPLRLGLWNVGGEGQLFLGAWAAAGIAFLLPTMSGPPLIALMLLGALGGGALWIAIPALARVYLGVSEIVGTLLLNFVAGYWVIYWAVGKWRDPLSAAGVRSELLPDQSELPHLHVGAAEVPVGFAIGVGIALIIWLVVRSTRTGYEITMLGSSPRAAHFAGIQTRALTLGVLFVGGALAGAGGAVQMVGEVHRYGDALSNLTGFIGVIIAVLAGGSEIGVLIFAVVFACISVGGNILRVGGTSSDLVFAMFGLTLVFAAMGQGLAHVRVVVRRRPREDSLVRSARALSGDGAGDA